MKKKLLKILGLSLFALVLGACGNDAGPSEPDPSGGGGNPPIITQTFTVGFEVDGVRYQTARVKDGEKITDEVPNPTKQGFNFIGWFIGEE